MYYYLYQITNKINNKIYIGVHQTFNLNDGYMGSGTYLLKDIKKYGKENFEKVILEYFDNEEEMYQKEKEIVDKNFINRNDTYNIVCGGNGLTSQNAKIIGSLKHVKEKRSQNMRKIDLNLWNNDPKRKDQIYQNFSKYWFSEELREKQSKKMTEQNNLNWKNPDYIQKQKDDRLGTIFIYNLKTNKKKRIWPDEIDNYPETEWRLSKSAIKKLKK